MPAAAHVRRLRETLSGPLTFGELAGRMGRDGIGLLAVVLAVPFLQPVPLAGLGTPVGLVLAAAGLQLARGKGELALPGFVARRRLDARVVEKLLALAERLLRFVERLTRPRWRTVIAPRVYGGVIAALGIALAVPVFVPLGSPSIALAIALLGLALLEEDGLIGLLGLLAAVASLALHVAFAALVWSGGKKLGVRL